MGGRKEKPQSHRPPHARKRFTGTNGKAGRQIKRGGALHNAGNMGDLSIQPEAQSGRLAAVAARPLAELLACPPEAGSLLAGASGCIEFDAGQVVFRQHESCQGLYVVVSGDFARKTERYQMRVTLGSARPGDLVELAAALGDGNHTYTLTALTPGSMLILPIEALHQAFQNYPPLRMRLLEELAREVSRAYITCCLSRVTPTRRHANGAGRN